MKRDMSPPVGGSSLAISTEEVARVSVWGKALSQGYCTYWSVTKEGTCLPLGLYIHQVNL